MRLLDFAIFNDKSISFAPRPSEDSLAVECQIQRVREF